MGEEDKGRSFETHRLMKLVSVEETEEKDPEAVQ